MLHEMLVSIRQDLLDQIRSRCPKKQKVPDSTTGMSTEMVELSHLVADLDFSSGDLAEVSASKYADLPEGYTAEINESVAESDNAENGGSDSSVEHDEEAETSSERISDNPAAATGVDGGKNGKGFPGSENNSMDEEDEEDEGVLLFRGRRSSLF